ncbi:MAG: UDP-N-acetylmuramate--L-alanine ligase, partial [Candidatus Desulfofervidus sp.]|nr:UDP-N-acetylmuramate--L-alanine ligase [Candidatus Desulfofervidus sp.]
IEAREIEFNTSTKFALYIRGKKEADISLTCPGKHNILNTLAALAVAKVLNIDIKTAIQGLKNFKGIARRLEIKGEKNEILIIDDYGHHPTEIKAVLEAIKQRWPHRRLITIFQPHRYSRTKALYNSFLTAFEKTNKLILTEIYPASEKPISGITGKWLAAGIAQYKTVDYCPDFTAIMNKLKEILRPMDILLTLGAGNIWQVGETILSQDI